MWDFLGKEQFSYQHERGQILKHRTMQMAQCCFSSFFPGHLVWEQHGFPASAP